jgi:glycosyltransferase involved in cell wall biosynthesis
MPLISVVIPVYNGEKTIRETIDSVLNQTFTDFEIVIINDGSQDATSEIITSIKDDRIKFFSYSNSGVSASRNRGIAKACGEFIACLDADDLWTSDKLEAQLKALQDNPQAAVAYSWTDYIDESGQFLYPGSYITLSGDVYAELLVKNFTENGSNPLIRKDALLQIGGFDEALFGPEDWDLFLRLASRYHFVAVPRPQILYRICANSTSSNILRQETQCLKVIGRAFEQAPESIQHLKKQSLANLYQYLTFRVLEGTLERQKSLLAARFLSKAIYNDPSLLRQRTKLIAIVYGKIAATVILPKQLVWMLKKTADRLSRKANPVESPKE